MRSPPAAASADDAAARLLPARRAAARHRRARPRHRIASSPSASTSCPAKQRLRLEGVSVEYQPASETPWAISACERERAEGRLAARARRQRRGPQLADRRLEACDDYHGEAAVLARHLERRVGRARRDPCRRLATPRDRAAHGLEGATLCELESQVHGTLRSSVTSALCALALALGARQRRSRSRQRRPRASARVRTRSSFDGANQPLRACEAPRITQGDLYIAADDAVATGVEFDATSEWRFTGNVRIEVGTAVMDADSAVFTFEQEQLSRGELEGAPASFTRHRSRDGQSRVTGTRQKMSYDYVARTLRMTGDVSVAARPNRGAGLRHHLRPHDRSASPPATADCENPFRLRRDRAGLRVEQDAAPARPNEQARSARSGQALSAAPGRQRPQPVDRKRRSRRACSGRTAPARPRLST